MPTPSGRISFEDIRVEFNGLVPILLSDYYLAPTGVVPIYLPNQGLPTSGPLSLADLRSRSRLRAVLPAGGFSFSGVGSTQRYIGFSLDPTDNLWRLRRGAGAPPSGVTSSGTWRFSGAASEYEIMCTATKDFYPASLARNVWYNLGGGATFYFDGQSIAPNVTGTVYIRYASTQLLLTTCGFNFSWDPGLPSITAGIAGSEPLYRGYGNGSSGVPLIGSISNADVSGLGTIVGIYEEYFSLTTSHRFTVEVSNNVSQNAFSTISFVGKGGVFRSFNTSSATFTHPGGTRSRWQWLPGDGPTEYFGLGETYTFNIS